MIKERPWWVEDPSIAVDVPVFSEFGISPVYTDGRLADADEWACAREQLWAMREGLA